MNKVKFFYKKGFRVTHDGACISSSGRQVGCIDSRGYIRISTRNKTENLRIPAHRLQAYQKYGDKMFEQGVEVRHLDGNRLNNSWDNIAIGTHSENMMDIPEHVRIAKAIHASSYVKKYEHDQVIAYYSNCRSYKKTMEKFGITSKGTLHFILNNSRSLHN